MLSPEHDHRRLPLPNYFVTPEYTSYSGRTYYTKTGGGNHEPRRKNQGRTGQDMEAANLQLKISDSIQTGDLLPSSRASDLGKVNPEDYSYTNSFKALKKIEKEKGDKSTSLYNQRGNQSTVDLFKGTNL